MDVSAHDRAFGALAGVAIGDAMGMPTQTLTRAQIADTYGAVTGFLDAAPSHPVSAGLKAGTITDDTEQTLLLARHLIKRGGHVDQRAWAQELLDWERDTHARGVNDLLGPSTKRAIDALQRGVAVTDTGRNGTTNGAAMRIVPVGIATSPEPLKMLVDAVAESCRLTHNTAEAIGAASAVAVFVSACIEGAAFEESLALVLSAAREGERRGEPARSLSIAAQIEKALTLADGASAVAVAEHIGTSVVAVESVPMAFAILRLTSGNVWKAAMLSAVIGDDTDTIGAISCGMAGAASGLARIPKEPWQQLCAVNGLDLEPIVSGLLSLRQGRAG